MLDWAKAIHEAIGIESPKVFIAVFALMGLLLFGFAGWVIDRGYRVSLRAGAGSRDPATVAERLRNGPRVLIDLAQCARGKCIRFQNVRDEIALRVAVKELKSYGLTLVIIPEVIASLRRTEPQDMFAVLSRPVGANTETMDISQYLERPGAHDLTFVVVFADLMGTHYETAFTTTRALTGQVQFHPGECEIVP